MLNLLWPIFLIISVFYAICFGDISKINSSIFESTQNAVNMCIKLLGTLMFWNGLMRILSKTSVMEKIKKLLKPVLRHLFPKLNENEEAYNHISMNMIANLLGLRKCSNINGS